MTTVAAATATAEPAFAGPPEDANLAGAAFASRGDVLALSLVTALWVLPMFFIGLHGGFPLNDDWAYHYSVRHFLSTGQFMRTDWTYVPLLSHTLLGSLFCLPTGFSFESLRLAGFVSGWLGVVGLYTLCRQAGSRPTLAAFAAVLLAFNPLYLNLSYTFMTEIPFTAMLIWAAVLFVHGLKHDSRAALAAGLVVCVAATLSRQFGLLLAAAFAAVAVLGKPRGVSRWTAAIAVVGVNLAAYAFVPGLVYRLLYVHGTARVDAWIMNNMVLTEHLPFLAARNGGASFMYLGLFFAPLTALLLASKLRQHPRLIPALAAACGLPLVTVVLLKGWRLPGQNLIYNLGIGPVSTLGHDQLPGAPAWTWWVLTFLGIVSASFVAAVLATSLLPRLKQLRSDPALLLPLLAAALLLGAVAPWRFDRYLVPAMPFAILALLHLVGAATPRRFAYAIAVASLALLALFSIAGTRDYLEYNRARWALLDPLVADGVSPTQIHGGFEFNRWLREHLPPEQRLDGIGYEPIVVTALEPGPDEVVLATRTYRRLLPFGRQTLRLLRRPVPPAAVDAAPVIPS